MTVNELPSLPEGIALPPLLDLISQAREAILRVYRGTAMHVEYKTDRSPLTLADRESHEILSAGLTKLAPGIPILSEEGSHQDWEQRSRWEYFWLVDPLDGTRDFVDRTDDFTINVALVRDQTAVVGILDVPMRETLYLGIHGQGAFRIQRAVVEPIRVSGRAPSDPGLRVAVSRSHSSRENDWLNEQGIHATESVAAGSALKFALVAEGSADLYPRLGPTMMWDTAAGQCLVEAAGGSMTQIDGQLFHYRRPDLTNTGFVVRGFASPSL